jgi:hypothetical protein
VESFSSFGLVNPFSLVVTKLLIISASQHCKTPYNINFTTWRPLAMKPRLRVIYSVKSLTICTHPHLQRINTRINFNNTYAMFSMKGMFIALTQFHTSKRLGQPHYDGISSGIIFFWRLMNPFLTREGIKLLLISALPHGDLAIFHH